MNNCPHLHQAVGTQRFGKWWHSGTFAQCQLMEELKSTSNEVWPENISFFLKFPWHLVHFLITWEQEWGRLSQQMSFIPVFPNLPFPYTHNCFLIWVDSGSGKVVFLLYFFLPSFSFSLTAQKTLLRSTPCDRHFASYLENHSHTLHASICKHADIQFFWVNWTTNLVL